MTETEECEECGAPRVSGLVACSYCEARYRDAAQGIDCPACGDDNAVTQLACASCGVSLQRSCVFCAQASSLARPTCGHCGESFLGAAERKREREERAQQEQLMGIAATGLSALGQAANSPTGRGLLDGVFDDLVDAAMGRKK